jgi:hypothetical protein
MIEGLFHKVPLPSAFVLQTADVQLAGTLKDEGMAEPISSYYFATGLTGCQTCTWTQRNPGGILLAQIVVRLF